MKGLQGGFYFHPSDEDLSPGTPEWKKPLSGRAIGYSYSGSAVASMKPAGSTPSVALPIPAFSLTFVSPSPRSCNVTIAIRITKQGTSRV